MSYLPSVFVVTLSAQGDKIDVTMDQLRWLRAKRATIRSRLGNYTTVTFGRHRGWPTFDSREWERVKAGEHDTFTISY